MSAEVIRIRLFHDLPTAKQNELRRRIELGNWKREWRIAEAMCDLERMDFLDRQYDRIGLP